MLNPAYDKFNFDRKVVRKILKFFVFFFLRKTVIQQYGKLVHMAASYLGLVVNPKVFIINNQNVTAGFISRFLAVGMRHGYDYYDMVIPIRKNLRRQMYTRK
jgi:hypothetical protein